MSIGTVRAPWHRLTWSTSIRRKDRRSRRSTFSGRGKSAAAKQGPDFPPIKRYTVNEIFGSWQNAQKTHFSDGGVFDQIYRPGP